RDPQAPLPHLALARVLARLGDDRDMVRRAVEEAHDAQLLAKDLPDDQRQAIEAYYRGLNNEPDAAIADFRKLVARYPDDLDYAEPLIELFRNAHKLDEAKAELARLRARPTLANDPRLDAMESFIAFDGNDRAGQRAALERGIE